MTNHLPLIARMIQYEKGCPQRVQHFLKVHSFAQLIAELEKVDLDTAFIIEAAAIVHDIGIRPSLEKYGSSSGNYQEAEGPALAQDLLASLGYEANVCARVAYLVGHHHTYTNIDGIDYQILVEADFLVNIFEDEMTAEQIASIATNIFRTKAGTELLKAIYQ